MCIRDSYTPVLKVNYNVESTRVGQAIDYDKPVSYTHLDVYKRQRAYTRCRICGRPHSVLRKYGVCRVCFRDVYKRQGQRYA